MTMTLTVEDRFTIHEIIGRYFRALETPVAVPLDDMKPLFEPDAVWELYEYQQDRPFVQFTAWEHVEKMLAANPPDSPHISVHHLFNVPTYYPQPDGTVLTKTTVLAFDQHWPWDPAPRTRNFAIVDGVWKKRDGVWRIARWSVKRSPSRTTPFPG